MRIIDIGNVFRFDWKLEKLQIEHNYPDSKVHGVNMGPSGSCRPQMGPMLVPQTLLSGNYICGVSTVPVADVSCYDICWYYDGQICIQCMPVAQIWRPTILRVLGYWLTFSVLKIDWNFDMVLENRLDYQQFRYNQFIDNLLYTWCLSAKSQAVSIG